ncbi:MAG: sigma-70 family RNA polymerase sigma factor [Clostridia bacterium]|nr:sigma-70 family RNA polymerase sigma factor [Clostridia bacterium]
MAAEEARKQENRITEEEAREYITAWRERGDQKAFDRLAEGYKYLIDSYTRNLKGTPHEQDIRMAAYELLLSAVKNFDMSRPTTVEAYFRTTIKQGLKNSFRQIYGDVPRSVKEIAPKVKAYRERYISEHEKEPTVRIMAEDLGLTEESVLEVLEYTRPVKSLSDPVSDDGNETELDYVQDPGDDYEALETRDLLRWAMEKLTPEERVVIELYFYGNQSEDKIAKSLGTNQMNVSRIKKRALDKMRTAIDKSP